MKILIILFLGILCLIAIDKAMRMQPLPFGCTIEQTTPNGECP